MGDTIFDLSARLAVVEVPRLKLAPPSPAPESRSFADHLSRVAGTERRDAPDSATQVPERSPSAADHEASTGNDESDSAEDRHREEAADSSRPAGEADDFASPRGEEDIEDGENEQDEVVVSEQANEQATQVARDPQAHAPESNPADAQVEGGEAAKEEAVATAPNAEGEASAAAEENAALTKQSQQTVATAEDEETRADLTAAEAAKSVDEAAAKNQDANQTESHHGKRRPAFAEGSQQSLAADGNVRKKTALSEGDTARQNEGTLRGDDHSSEEGETTSADRGRVASTHRGDREPGSRDSDRRDEPSARQPQTKHSPVRRQQGESPPTVSLTPGGEERAETTAASTGAGRAGEEQVRPQEALGNPVEVEGSTDLAESKPSADRSHAAELTDRSARLRGAGQGGKSAEPSQQPRPGPDPTRFVQRVARAFDAARERGGEVRLRLSPPELGALRLQVQVRGGEVHARLEAETPAARSLLLENVAQLRERLSSQDIRVGRLDVDLMEQSFDHGQQQQSERETSSESRHWQTAGRGRAGQGEGEGRPEAAAETASPGRPMLNSDGQLNIVI